MLSYRFVGFTLVALFASTSFVMIWIGAAPIAGPWDVISLLNASWRILNGQIPYVDFHDPIGPLTYIPIVLSMKLAGPSTSAIAYGTVLLVALLIPWAWCIASSRLPPLAALLVVTFCGFLLISPRPLGFGIRETTYAMIYNREGYVLLSMFLIGILLPPAQPAKYKSMLSALSSGLLLGLLLYCKVTYFAVAGGTVLLGIILNHRSVNWFIGVGVGLAGVIAVFYLFFHVHLTNYFSDIITSGQCQSSAFRWQLLKAAVKTNLLWIFLSFVFVGLWTYVSGLSGHSIFSSARLWLIAAWGITMALFLDSGNAAQRGGQDDPLFFVTAVIVFESFHRQNLEQIRTTNSSATLTYAATVLVLLPLFCGSILVRDFLSFSHAAAWDIVRGPAIDVSRRIHVQPLRDLLVPPDTQHITSYWPAKDFPMRMNEGLDLLHKHLSKSDRVTSIGFTDPFSFAFGLQPPIGGNQWWDLNMDFNQSRHPSPEQFLGDVSLVMVPRRVSGIQGWNFDTVDAMLQIYGSYLQTNFEQTDSSESWTLYRRRLPSFN